MNNHTVDDHELKNRAYKVYHLHVLHVQHTDYLNLEFYQF